MSKSGQSATKADSGGQRVPKDAKKPSNPDKKTSTPAGPARKTSSDKKSS